MVKPHQNDHPRPALHSHAAKCHQKAYKTKVVLKRALIPLLLLPRKKVIMTFIFRFWGRKIMARQVYLLQIHPSQERSI